MKKALLISLILILTIGCGKGKLHNIFLQDIKQGDTIKLNAKWNDYGQRHGWHEEISIFKADNLLNATFTKFKDSMIYDSINWIIPHEPFCTLLLEKKKKINYTDLLTIDQYIDHFLNEWGEDRCDASYLLGCINYDFRQNDTILSINEKIGTWDEYNKLRAIFFIETISAYIIPSKTNKKSLTFRQAFVLN